MSSGYGYTCKNCGHRYMVTPGIGMLYPTVYREMIGDIARGKYGLTLQGALLAIPYAAINGERAVYVCDGCGTWEQGTDVSLYAPNNPKDVAQEQYGEKTVAEWGYVPCVMPEMLKEEYHLVKRHYRTCGRCGKRMRKATAAEQKALPCPVCGCENRAEGAVMWD